MSSLRKEGNVKLAIALMLMVSVIGVAAENLKEQIKFGNEAAKQGLWNEARFRWQKVIDADPSNGSAHNNIGVALEREGKIEQAVVEYRLAVKLLPDNSYARKNLQRSEELLKNATGEQKKVEAKK